MKNTKHSSPSPYEAAVPGPDAGEVWSSDTDVLSSLAPPPATAQEMVEEEEFVAQMSEALGFCTASPPPATAQEMVEEEEFVAQMSEALDGNPLSLPQSASSVQEGTGSADPACQPIPSNGPDSIADPSPYHLVVLDDCLPPAFAGLRECVVILHAARLMLESPSEEGGLLETSHAKLELGPCDLGVLSSAPIELLRTLVMQGLADPNLSTSLASCVQELLRPTTLSESQFLDRRAFEQVLVALASGLFGLWKIRLASPLSLEHTVPTSHSLQTHFRERSALECSGPPRITSARSIMSRSLFNSLECRGMYQGDVAPVCDGVLPYDTPDEIPQPEVAKIRLKVRPSRDGRVRSKTIAPRRLTREEKREALALQYPEGLLLPRLPGQCQNVERPCPFVSCEHHLYLDVNPQSGAIKLNFPHLEVWEMAETCALDVADRGGITLEEVGAILNLTRERIRQVEVRGLGKIREQSDDEHPSQSPLPGRAKS
jgi:hypothetical protein